MLAEATTRDPIDVLLARTGALDDDAVRRVLDLLEQLHRRVAADLARRPDLAASDLGRLHAEIDAAIADYQGRLTHAVQSSQEDAWHAGRALIDGQLAAAGVRVGTVGLSDTTLRLAQAYTADLIRGISEDARRKITTQVRLAALGGRSFSDLMHAVGTEVDRGAFASVAARAEAIARTEVSRVLNTAAYQSLGQASQLLPGLGKRWVHSPRLTWGGKPGQYRPRLNHVALDGVVVPYDGVFDLGGVTARFPHDPALPASEAVNCACRCVADLSGVRPATGRIDLTGVPSG